MTTEMGVELAGLVEALEFERQRFETPGMAVAVIRDRRTVLARGFGLRDVAARLPATERTLFAIGSTTKAFTATLIAALVGDGLLEWDRPVREYLPRFRLHDPVATELITVRDLLCHRSGLPRHDLVWYANPDMSRRELVERLRHLEPNRSFREVWQYNNLMFITAGYLAGELLGSSWEEGVRERLLGPLSMADTFFSLTEARRAADWSRGYRERDEGPEELAPKDFPLSGPAGSMYSSVTDLARWMEVNLGAGRVGEREVIAPSALRTLHSPAMVVAEQETMWPERFGIGYGLGWALESYRGHRLVHHGGAIEGYTAKVVMAPEAGAGAIVLTNHYGTALPDVACYRIMDELLGLPPLPWGKRMRDLQIAARKGGREATERRRAAAADAPPAHPESAYAGEYHHPGYGSLQVTAGDDGLHARLGDLDLDMTHRHFETWDVTLTILETPFPLTFTTDADGEVTSLAVPFEPAVAPIVFQRQPPAELSDPDRLATFVGTYAMGPLRARVRLEETHLSVELINVQTLPLTPATDRTFTVKGRPSIRIQFVVDNGRAVEMEIQPGVGVFTREPENYPV
ncbi:serine hydrolase [Nocardia terpenica]|uniref:Serine hydrolase n=1 Tax=Nocardia terpenica TaxID=455432 RepID=A0A291RJR6_9NOCA|nr:serine hydrolase [Nocardia terpenica]ATL67816.1 hypothetical protein CRH09_18060 [Nocardia terpenica]